MDQALQASPIQPKPDCLAVYWHMQAATGKMEAAWPPVDPRPQTPPLSDFMPGEESCFCITIACVVAQIGIRFKVLHDTLPLLGAAA